MKPIKCYRLIAGDVLRYSNDCLIEYYCMSTYNTGETRYFTRSKIVSSDAFKAELSFRSKKQEISNAYFERIATKIRSGLALRKSQRLESLCFDVPGGSKSRFSSDTLIERIKINGSTCEIEESTSPEVLFKSYLSHCSSQYKINDNEFDEIRNKAQSMIEPLAEGLQHQTSSKVQIELF